MGKKGRGVGGPQYDMGNRGQPVQSPNDLILDPDTIMMVVDPATRQKVPIMFSQTEATNGRVAYINNIGTKRDSYLCMLYQKGRCKSHGRCNQIHANRDLVKELRSKHLNDGSCVENPVNDEPLAHQRAVEVVVVEPTNAQSRIVIPYLKTEETVGRRVFFQQQEQTGLSSEVHICSSIIQGVICPQGESCSKIHPDRAFLKFIIEPNKPCCPFHGTDHTVDYKGKVFMINKNNQRCPLPLDRLMTTKGLRGLMTSPTTLAFACNRVCRLHQEKRCQWGRECANLHICREFYAIYGSCVNLSITSLPSLPGLQILPSGKLKPVEKMNPHDPRLSPSMGHPHGHQDGVTVTGMPLNNSINETFAIPLVTQEGPVPRELLPLQAQKRYPGATAVGVPTGMIKGRDPNGHPDMNNMIPTGVYGTQPPPPSQMQVVPDGLKNIADVDSEPATPPLSPQAKDVMIEKQVAMSGLQTTSSFHDPHQLMTASSTLSVNSINPPSLHTQPSLHTPSYHQHPPLAAVTAAGVPPPGIPMPPHQNMYLPQTWSEYERRGGPIQQPHPLYFSPQHVSEMLTGPPPTGDPAELGHPIDSFSDIRQPPPPVQYPPTHHNVHSPYGAHPQPHP